MAYVRRTDTMVDDIVSKINEMRSKALEPYDYRDPLTGSEEYKSALEVADTEMWKEAPELKGKMPDSWLRGVERIRLTVKDVPSSSDYTSRMSIQTELRFGDDVKHMIPPCYESGYYGAPLKVEYKDLPHGSKFKEWIDTREKLKSDRQKVEGQWNVVRSQIKDYLYSHASLNAAIKEMPELEMYVPGKYIARLHEATEPRARQQAQKPKAVEELGIDRDALATMAIASRITSASA